MEVRTLTDGRWQPVCSEERVRVLPGVYAPIHVQAHGALRNVMQFVLTEEKYLDNSPTGSTVVGIEAFFSEEHGHYVLRSLSVNAPEGEEVNGVLMREVAPQRIMRWALARALHRSTGENGTPYISRWAVQYLQPHLAGSDNVKMNPVEGGPTAENIKAIAEIYRLAEVIRDAPAKAVADTMGLQPRTATNWINRARAEGLLNG